MNSSNFKESEFVLCSSRGNSITELHGMICLRKSRLNVLFINLYTVSTSQGLAALCAVSMSVRGPHEIAQRPQFADPCLKGCRFK